MSNQTPEEYIEAHEKWCMDQHEGTMYGASIVHMKNLVAKTQSLTERIKELESYIQAKSEINDKWSHVSASSIDGVKVTTFDDLQEENLKLREALEISIKEAELMGYTAIANSLAFALSSAQPKEQSDG